MKTQGDSIQEGRSRKLQSDWVYVNTFKNGDTTPTVKDLKIHMCGTSVVTITDFDDGYDGQEIKIKGHGNTTIANNANIKTNTGGNKVLVVTKVYTFTLFLGVWYENE